MADLQHPFFVGVFDHRHHQAIGCVGGKANVPIVLIDQCIAIERAVELGVFFECGHASLDQKRQHGDLDSALFVFFVGQHPKGFQVGDVGVVVVGDRRDHDGIAQQIRTADLFDAAHFFALDGTKLGKVHFGPGNQTERSTVTTRWGFGRLGLGAGVAGHHRTGEGLHIVFDDAALDARAFDLGQRHAQ